MDGVTVGLGLTAYHGELTAQANFDVGDVLRGGVNAFVGIDRQLDPLFVGLEVGFTRIRSRSQWKSFSNNIVRIEAQTGVGVDWIRPDFLRFFSGVNLLLHHPNYTGDGTSGWASIERSNSTPDGEGLKAGDVGAVEISSSIPFFVVIDDHVRVGFRLMVDDYIDNAGRGNEIDFLFHVTLMHRFGLR